jgi:hypothetical protein
MENRRYQNSPSQNENESSRTPERTSRGESDESFASGANNHLFDPTSNPSYPNRVHSNWSIENERTYGKDRAWLSPEERQGLRHTQDRYWTRDFSGTGEYGNDLVRNSELSHIGKGPKGYQRSDERIKEDVSEALYKNPNVDASDVEVKVESGIVTLSGTIEDRQMKRLAEDVAARVSGVLNVMNLLTVHHNGWFSGNPRIS